MHSINAVNFVGFYVLLILYYCKCTLEGSTLHTKFSIQGIIFVGGPVQINTTLDYQQELNLTVTNFTSAENLFVLGKFFF